LRRGCAAGRRNLLDPYRHRARPSGGPVLIHLHGGGYYRGRKNSQSLPLLYRLASQGWICVSANYRLRPAAQHPDHLIDLKKVIAWVRAHGPEYGADPGLLFVSGSSAGAHMASLAALTPNDPSFQPGFEDADTSVTAAIGLNGWYGGYYGQEDASSPLAHVRPDAPPFFIAHGDHDTVAPVEVARYFAGKLGNVSTNPVVYAELPGAQHAFDLFGSLRFEMVVDAIEAFAAWVRSREIRSGHDLRLE
jgi:acetyl esterase/lipase